MTETASREEDESEPIQVTRERLEPIRQSISHVKRVITEFAEEHGIQVSDRVEDFPDRVTYAYTATAVDELFDEALMFEDLVCEAGDLGLREWKEAP